MLAPLCRRAVLLAACLAAAPALRADTPAAPQTVAEKSDFKATSRHADVIAFCEALARRSPLVRLGEMGTSGEGRPLTLLILSDPPVATPEEAARTGKPVVLITANIHAGEVDGKEAVLMLARDLTADGGNDILKKLVVVICPDFNPDGNEKIDKKHRTSQNGPAEGVGVRTNAAGYDLNRDYVKLETPEVRALVRAFNRWNPALYIDCHTTNGSKHRYTMTYQGPRHPSCPPGLVEMVRDRLLPDAGRSLEKATGFHSFFYGNFSRDRSRWETVPAQPRYGTEYAGLRGRAAVLVESYSYAPFRDRVKASYGFVRGCLEYAAEHPGELRKLLQPGKPPEQIALRTKNVPVGGEQKVLGFEEEEKEGRRVATDTPKEYTLQYVGKSEPTLSVARPYAYLFPASFAKAVEVLQRHGVEVDELHEDVQLDLEAYRVDKVTPALQEFQRQPQEYQKHRMVQIDATSRKEAKMVPAGTILVRTGQPLGTLAAVLLEPQSEDGLGTWNFFDEGLAEGKDYPVLRLPAAARVTAGPVRPLPEDRVLNKPFVPEMLYSGLGAGGGAVPPRGGRGQVVRGQGAPPPARGGRGQRGQRAPAGGPPNLSGNPVFISGWLDDGEHFLQTIEGELCRVEARTGRAEPFIDVEKLTKSLQADPGLDANAAARRTARGPLSRTDPKRTGVLVEHDGNLFFARFDGTAAVKLTDRPGEKEQPTFSPDGKYVAYTTGGNLHAVDLATQTDRALTKDGGGKILNGKADWVYWEEIFNRNPRPFVWSPDSKSIAFLRFDDTPVHSFTVIDEVPVRQKLEVTPYPKSGDPNPHVKLGVVGAEGGEVRFADLSAYPADDMLIHYFGWTPDNRVWLYVQNRTQTWLDFVTCGREGGPVTKLFRETTKAWVNNPGDPTFLKDGSFLLASERTGWRHLYHFAADGKLIGPVTQGEWEARSLHVADEKDGWVYFSGTKDSPIATNLYRCRLDGTGLERLTPVAGTHQASVSPKGNLFLDTHSSFAEPQRVRLCAADGKPVRVVDSNPAYDREEYRFGPLEHVQIPLPDGFVLEGVIIRPPDFDPSRRYPVWVSTYAGPHAPMVRDAWDGGRVMDQVLAGMGIIAFRVDPRSASGKGAVSAWAAYRKLGVQELKDLEGAVDWICRNPWADASRVGINGGSYGGFMTSYALTHSKHFAAGVAAAPVTDWHNYDTIYTERYMGTPQDNPEGYEVTSVVKAARNLHGRLLLQHGVMDDNVHFQNTLQLADELQKAGKEFEVMFYPHSRHGGFGPYSQRETIEFIRRTMLERPPHTSPGAAPASNGRAGPRE
jgi:dipeptidyl aminopeptidase/acylaminoacyl peptidase